MCKSTVGIRFDTEFSEFFAILQVLFGNSCLNVLCGPCHFGHVVTEKSTRGLYDPSTSECNFAIPSRTMLQKIDIGYPKEVPPGFINHTLDVASGLSDKGEHFVCSFDGKTLSISSKGETTGDIDMWGVEPKSMNIHHNLQHRNSLLSFLDKMTAQVTQVNLPHRQKELRELMKQITYSVSRIQTCFCAEFYLNKRLTKMQVSNPNNSIKYQTALGAIHVKLADCNNAV